MERILTMAQFRALVRPSSQHLDEACVMSFVDEAVTAYVLPVIGYRIYKECASDNPISGMAEGFSKDILLNGGEWEQASCICEENETQCCSGLRKALSYFAYARMMRADGAVVSRAGLMRHRDEYGDHVATDKQYQDVMSMAETYLGECAKYLKAYSLEQHINRVPQTRARIKAIGG